VTTEAAPPPPVTTEAAPPPVTTEAPPPLPAESPSASFSPSSGPRGVPLTFAVSGFAPNSTLQLTLTWPDGTVEHFTMDTDASGGAQRGFQGYSNNPSGTYTAVAVNPATGAQAQAQFLLVD
jgi:hypothetical protein